MMDTPTLWKCQYCSKKYNHKSNLYRHTKNVHSRNSQGEIISVTGTPSKSFTCGFCEKQYTSKHSLEFHINNVHFPHDNNLSFSCGHCDYKTSLKSSLKTHTKRRHNTEKNLYIESIRRFKCSNCDASYRHEKHLAYHKRKSHSIGKPKYVHEKKCPLCSYIVTNNENKKEIYSHFEKVHDVHVKWEEHDFDSLKDFYAWKDVIERKTVSSFINRYTCNKPCKSVYTYRCHRNGTYIHTGLNKRSLKTSGSCKINGFCPASIKATVDNNKVHVLYTLTHVGHKTELKHIRLTKEERQSIAALLATGESHDMVIKMARSSISNAGLNRYHLTNKQDIRNIVKEFNLHEEAINHPFESISINSPVTNNISEHLDEVENSVENDYPPPTVDIAPTEEMQQSSVKHANVNELVSINNSVHLDAVASSEEKDYSQIELQVDCYDPLTVGIASEEEMQQLYPVKYVNVKVESLEKADMKYETETVRMLSTIDATTQSKPMRSSRKIMATQWGIISAGKISNDFAAAVKTLSEEEHIIVAVAARNIKSAKEFASKHKIPNFYGSYEELLKNSEIEVVYVGVVHPLHFEVAKMCLEHGKNVLCEKPLCMNEKQARQLVQMAKSKSLFLMEAVWSRCFPVYEHLRTLLMNNVVGEILYLNVQFGAKIDVDRIWKKELGGGTVLDLGIYTLQIATLIFGNKPSTMVAGGHLNSEGVDQGMSAILTYPSGATAVLSTHSKVELPNTAVIVGTEGTIQIEAPFWAPTKITLLGSECFKEEKEFSLPQSVHKFNFMNSVGLSYEAVEVRRCLIAGLLESPLITHEDSIHLARLEDEIRRQLGVHYPEDDD